MTFPLFQKFSAARRWSWLLPAVLLLSSFAWLRQAADKPTAQAPAAAQAEGQPTCVYLLRHAEKRSDEGQDPGLTELGQQRAEALAELLQRSQVTHLFASEYRRTQDTLQPLAKQCGKTVEVLSVGDSEALAQRLRELPAGSVAVVAGHSNTVPAVCAELGAPLSGLVDSRYGRMFPEKEYGRLVQLVLVDQGEPWLHELVVTP